MDSRCNNVKSEDDRANINTRVSDKIKGNPNRFAAIFAIIGICLFFMIRLLNKTEEIEFPYFSLIRFDVSTLDETTMPLPTYEITITFIVRNPYSVNMEYNEMEVFVYDAYSMLDKTSLHPFTVQKGFVNVKAKCIVNRPFEKSGVVDFRVQTLAVRKPSSNKKQELIRFLCNPIRVGFKNSSDVIGSMVRSAESDCALDA